MTLPLLRLREPFCDRDFFVLYRLLKLGSFLDKKFLVSQIAELERINSDKEPMLRGEESDDQLMVLYQGGSEEAFQVLFSRHSGKVYGYLRSRTYSEQETADLFQEVFVKIHKSKHLYNKSLPVLPWIFSVAHSVWIDGHRKVGRRKEVYGVDFDGMATEGKNESRYPDVLPLTQGLPHQQQIVLQMRYVEEKTFEEIAESLKTSPVNVRQIVSRGIRHLRELLKKEKSHE